MVVIAAVDRSDRAPRVVAEAVSLGNAFDEPVHVVHSMTRSKFVDLGIRSAEGGDPVSMDEVRKLARDVADDAIEDASIEHETDVSAIKRVGLVGDPDEEIVEYAEREDARYVVVMGRKQSAAAKVLFGSVAQSILLNAPCSVVTPSIRRPE